jgi:hypothetical protein
MKTILDTTFFLSCVSIYFVIFLVRALTNYWGSFLGYDFSGSSRCGWCLGSRGIWKRAKRRKGLSPPCRSFLFVLNKRMNRVAISC